MITRSELNVLLDTARDINVINQIVNNLSFENISLERNSCQTNSRERYLINDFKDIFRTYANDNKQLKLNLICVTAIGLIGTVIANYDKFDTEKINDGSVLKTLKLFILQTADLEQEVNQSLNLSSFGKDKSLNKVDNGVKNKSLNQASNFNDETPPSYFSISDETTKLLKKNPNEGCCTIL